MIDEKVFMKRELEKPSWLQRLFGITPKINAVIEINNLLAEKPVKELSPNDIENIAEEYNVNVIKKFKPELLEFYRRYLNYCLNDKHLSDTEINDLKHLKCLFNVNDKDFNAVYREVTKRIYKTEVEKAVSNGRLEPEEKDFIEKLRSNLKISDDLASKIYQESSEKLIKRFVNNAVSDERLSREEEEELNEIAASLGVDLSFEENTKRVFDKYKLYWKIENEEIPSIDVDINLQRKERCYFHTQTDWLEQRRVTKRIRYSGPTVRLKIVKGVYWRMGDLGIQPVSEEQWKVIDSGHLFLTNKRLIFMGSHRNKTIRLNRILNFVPYTNGVEIQKDRGKNPFLKFSRNVDVFSMILGRVMFET